MPHEARVKERVVPKVVRFAGVHEFVRYEWRSLPDSKLELARNNPYLDIREVEGDQPEPADSVVALGGAVVQDIEPSVVADDLTAIKGIGISTAAFMATYGYTTYASLADEDVEKLQGVLANAKYPMNKLDAKDLIRQAKELR